MAKQITQTIRFKSQKSGAITTAEMRAVTFTNKEQKMRALKTFLIFFLIASFCVLIPVAHLVLVPSFLVGGIIAAKRRWNKDAEGIDAKGSCPDCRNNISIDLEKNAEFPQWHNCPECGDALELQADPGKQKKRTAQ